MTRQTESLSRHTRLAGRERRRLRSALLTCACVAAIFVSIRVQASGITSAVAFGLQDNEPTPSAPVSPERVLTARMPTLLSSLELVPAVVGGESLKRSSDGSVQVRFDDSRGFWRYMGPPPNAQGSITEADALELANALAKDAQIPNSEIQRRVVTSIETAYSSGSHQIVGYHARILRQVRGIRVWDSRFMITIDLNGRIARAEVMWPEFHVDETAPVMTRDEAIDRVTGELQSSQVPFDHFTPHIVYMYDKPARVHHPVLVVEGWHSASQSDEPALVEVALTRRELDP